MKDAFRGGRSSNIRPLILGVFALATLCAPQIALAQDAAAPKDAVQRWIELAIPYALKAVGALVLFVIARIVAGWTGRLIKRGLETRKFDVTMTRFFSALGRTLVLLAAVLGILGMFGVETTSFAAVIGAAGLAIGLAFQGTLGNFASGVLLLTFRPFKVGDLVKCGGETGIVEEIGLFTTTLMTPDNLKIIVPNSGVTGGNITNFTGQGKRRVDIPVGTAYGADLDAVRKALETVPAKIEKGLKDPSPQIFLKALGDSAILWEVRVWAHPDSYWDVYQAIVCESKKALDRAGIEIPFPQVTVTMSKPN